MTCSIKRTAVSVHKLLATGKVTSFALQTVAKAFKMYGRAPEVPLLRDLYFQYDPELGG